MSWATGPANDTYKMEEAKRKVALRACERLHKDGLLGDDLLLKRKEVHSSDECSDEEDTSNKKRGTKSFKEY